MNTLKAEKRNMQTKAKKLRREGFVTGNVFGREMKESMPIQILKADAERLVKTHGKGSQVMLEVDGQTMDVLVKEIDLSPLKTEIYEIDFQALVSGEKVHSVAEVVLLNHEKVNTGLVNQMLHEIAFKAVPAALVEKVEIDVGDMKLGDSIQVKDLWRKRRQRLRRKPDRRSPDKINAGKRLCFKAWPFLWLQNPFSVIISKEERRRKGEKADGSEKKDHGGGLGAVPGEGVHGDHGQ